MDDTLTHYVVRWQIDIEATSPREAAEQALAIQRNNAADNIANVFDVWVQNTETIANNPIEFTTIDLADPDSI